MSIPNEVRFLELGSVVRSYEVVSESRVYQPVSLPWSEDVVGSMGSVSRSFVGKGGKGAFLCGGRYGVNKVDEDFEFKVYRLDVGAADDGNVDNYNRLKTSFTEVVDVEETWEVVYDAADGDVGYVFAVNGSVVREWVDEDEETFISQVVTYSGVSFVEVWSSSGGGAGGAPDVSGNNGSGVVSESLFDVDSVGVSLGNVVFDEEDLRRTKVGVRNVAVNVGGGGGEREYRSYDSVQVLSDEITGLKIKGVVDGVAGLGVDDDGVVVSRVGGAHMSEESRVGYFNYVYAGGVGVLRRFADRELVTSFNDRDAEVTKNLVVWNGGLVAECETTRSRLGMWNGRLTSGRKRVELSGRVEESKMYRDELGVFHRDYLDMDDVLTRLEGEFAMTDGYLRMDDYFRGNVGHIYRRERLVCVDGVERRLVFSVSGLRFNGDGFFIDSEDEVNEELVLETDGFVTDWLEQESSVEEFSALSSVEVRVYVRDAEDEWVEEVEGAVMLQRWDDLCDAKYFVESKYRGGDLWGYRALDYEDDGDSSTDGSAERWMDRSVRIVGSSSGGEVGDCDELASVSINYEATANYDEVTGWIDNQVLSEVLVIGGVNCKINGIDDVGGLREENLVDDPITGLGFAFGNSSESETLLEQEYDGDGVATVYYRRLSVGILDDDISSGFSEVVLEYPHSGPSFLDGFMISDGGVDLPVSKGEYNGITRMRMMGRV